MFLIEMSKSVIRQDIQYKKLKRQAVLLINKLNSRKDIAIGISLIAIIFSLYNLSITNTSFLFENADLFKLSLFASGVSPYSTLPWQAPYPPLYFILWIVPYLIITSIAHAMSRVYLGFKVLSLALIYLVTFLIYKSLISGYGNKYRSLILSSIFLIFAQATLIVLTGDSLGILLLIIGAFLFVKRKNLLGVLFVSMAVLFKVHPVIGLFLVLVALARNSIIEFKKAALIVVLAGIFLFAVPMALISSSFSSFLVFESNSLQLYTFNIYSGALGLLSTLLYISNPLTSSVATILDYIWIATTLFAIGLLSFIVLKKDNFKNAKLTDILAIGLLVWLLLLKQTLPYYYIWPLAVLILSNRIKSAAFLITGNILGSTLFYYGYGLLGNATTINYALAPPITVSLCFLIGGVMFALFDFLAIRQIIVEIDR